MVPKDIKYLVIHTSDSKWGDVATIRKWHTDPLPAGRAWSNIGYHFVITNQFPSYNSLKGDKPDSSSDGVLSIGRPIGQSGVHCTGYNDKSIGICLVGSGGKYTQNQLDTLYITCLQLMTKYDIPVVNVIGHYETPSGKAQGKSCPDMPMPEFRDTLSFVQRLISKLKP